MHNSIQVKPIAWVQNARTIPSDDNWSTIPSTITLDEKIPTEAFEGIEAYSHLEIIFHFDKLPEEKVVHGKRHPRNKPEFPECGIYAQRGAARPNRFGATIVRLVKCDGRTLSVEGLDAIDGTPVIDIKPVFRQFLPSGEIRQPEWVDRLMKTYF